MSSARQLKERKDKCTNYQLHPKRVYEEPEPQPEMSPDQMTVAEKALETAEKACYEASRRLLNLSISIRNPSPEQAEIFRGRVTELRDEVENMRLMFLR